MLSKKGNFIEATMVLPVAVLILIGLIFFMLFLYQQLQQQIQEHQVVIEEMYLDRVTDDIRIYDRWIR